MTVHVRQALPDGIRARLLGIEGVREVVGDRVFANRTRPLNDFYDEHDPGAYELPAIMVDYIQGPADYDSPEVQRRDATLGVTLVDAPEAMESLAGLNALSVVVEGGLGRRAVRAGALGVPVAEWSYEGDAVTQVPGRNGALAGVHLRFKAAVRVMDGAPHTFPDRIRT